MANYHTLEISHQHIKDILLKALTKGKTENADSISDVIIGYLNRTDSGIRDLTLAFLGSDFTPKYKVGDQVMVKLNHLHTWRFNTSYTRDANLVNENDEIEINITNIDKYVKDIYSYTVRVMSDKNELLDVTGSISQESIIDIKKIVKPRNLDDLR